MTLNKTMAIRLTEEDIQIGSKHMKSIHLHKSSGNYKLKP